jgi:hypothetical protein
LVRSYEFIQGGLDDIDQLPVLANLPEHIYAKPKELLVSRRAVPDGQRGDTLWSECMKAAKDCDDFDALLDFARTRNAEYLPPMTDARVLSAAESAWNYTQRGENRFGQPKFWFGAEDLANMLANPDAFLLLAFLRFHNGPHATFMCANGLAEKFGWSRERLAGARRRLIELDYIAGALRLPESEYR